MADAWYILVFVEGINASSAISLKDAISLPLLGILLPRPLLGDGRGSGEDDGFTHFGILQDTQRGPFEGKVFPDKSLSHPLHTLSAHRRRPRTKQDVVSFSDVV